MSRWIAALASALLVVGCELPGTVKARAFTTGFRAGQSVHYQVHTVLSGTLSAGSSQLPVDSDLRASETLEVDAVDRAGTASLTITTDTLTDSSGAALTNKPAPAALKIAADGRILEGSGAQVGGRLPSLPGADQLTPILPGHPVKPGDSWDRTYARPNPFGAGSFSLTAHSRYLRDEPVGSRQAAVIETTLTGPLDFTIDFSKVPNRQPGGPTGSVHYVGSVNSKSRFWLDTGSGGGVLKATASGDYSLSYAIVVPASQAGGPQQISFNGRIKTDLNRL